MLNIKKTIPLSLAILLGMTGIASADLNQDRSTYNQDVKATQAARKQLAKDTKAKNNAAIAADKAAIQADVQKNQQDRAKINADKKALRQTGIAEGKTVTQDNTALRNARKQLSADLKSNNKTTLANDKAAIQNAKNKIRADQTIQNQDLNSAR